IIVDGFQPLLQPKMIITPLAGVPVLNPPLPAASILADESFWALNDDSIFVTRQARSDLANDASFTVNDGLIIVITAAQQQMGQAAFTAQSLLAFNEANIIVRQFGLAGMTADSRLPPVNGIVFPEPPGPPTDLTLTPI